MADENNPNGGNGKNGKVGLLDRVKEDVQALKTDIPTKAKEQLDGLKALGVNFAQGYLLGRPVTAPELEKQPVVFQPRRDAA